MNQSSKNVYKLVLLGAIKISTHTKHATIEFDMQRSIIIKPFWAKIKRHSDCVPIIEMLIR